MNRYLTGTVSNHDPRNGLDDVLAGDRPPGRPARHRLVLFPKRRLRGPGRLSHAVTLLSLAYVYAIRARPDGYIWDETAAAVGSPGDRSGARSQSPLQSVRRAVAPPL